jgi:hypothetical protein
VATATAQQGLVSTVAGSVLHAAAEVVVRGLERYRPAELIDIVCIGAGSIGTNRRWVCDP